MLLDDCDMRPVAVLVDFLKQEEDRWRHLGRRDRTEVFQKVRSDALDVAWHMQPWTIKQTARALLNRGMSAVNRRIR